MEIEEEELASAGRPPASPVARMDEADEVSSDEEEGGGSRLPAAAVGAKFAGDFDWSSAKAQPLEAAQRRNASLADQLKAKDAEIEK